MFDMMNDLTGNWPVEISAVAALHRNKVYETAHIHAKFADGMMATATLSWVIPKKTRQVSLIGESRSMFIDAVGQEIMVFESGYTYKLGFERNNTIRDELLHFIDSFGKPSAETKNSGVIGVRTVELIESAKKSAETGKAIAISIR
jgi:predicted dehydrogenase